MKTAVLAGEIANHAIDQLKIRAVMIREMSTLSHLEIRDIIRDSALHVLNKFAREAKREKGTMSS